MPVALLSDVSGVSTGNVDFTNADMAGATPKGCIILASEGEVNGTRTNDAVLSVTYFDGTNTFNVNVQAEHGQADTDNDRESATLFNKINNGNHALDFSASLTMIADGVRANFSNAPDNSYLLKFVFFYGDDVSFVCGSADANTTEDLTIDIAPGFPAKLLMTACVGRAFDAAGATRLQIGLGVAESGGANRAVLLSEDNGLGTSAPNSFFLTNRCGGNQTAGGGIDWTIEATAWGATTITITTRDGAPGTAEDFMWCAIDPGDVSVWVGTLQTPTSSGEWSISDPSFTPEFLGMVTSMCNSLDTQEQGSDNGQIGMGACTVDGEWSIGVNIEDGQDTTNTSSLGDTSVCNFDEHDGTPGIIGTLTEFDADGADIELTTVIAAAGRYFAGFAIEEPQIGFPPLPSRRRKDVQRLAARR